MAHAPQTEGPGAAPRRRAPHVVVVPFAVPEDGRDLGLGIAAIVHAFARIEGHDIALAQLLSRESSGREPQPIEVFVSPTTWKNLTSNDPTSEDIRLILTGTFEPPTHGRGLLQLLAFDAKDGTTRAEVEESIDGEHAGEALLRALEQMCSAIGGELARAKDIGALGWEALESVLRAERCALHDPLRGGPHDCLAALVHLGRAIGDAPEASYPASRLAAIALDTVLARPGDARVAATALRAVERAIGDAPFHVDLLEAAAALHMRCGEGEAAEAHARLALEREPDRARLHALLSEARRARGDTAGALAAISEGIERVGNDPLLATERGIILADRGDVLAARDVFAGVLSAHPGYGPAFANLVGCGARLGDHALVGQLVDEAPTLHLLPIAALRKLLQLTLNMGTDDASRAARVVKLAGQLTLQAADPWVELVQARALARLGDPEAALHHLERVESLAPESALAAEARRGRFALASPAAAQELEDIVNAAYGTDSSALPEIVSRARHFAEEHDVWCAHLALGIAERRRGRWEDARVALEAAIASAAGCAPAHMELVAVHIALGRGEDAITSAERARALEGDTARTLSILATAFLAAGRHDNAKLAIDRALALDDSNKENQALARRIQASSTAQLGPLARLRGVLAGWRSRR